MTLARLLTVATVVATLGAPVSAEARREKLDNSLRQTVERGCVGTISVIIRTKPGSREAVRLSLAQGGRKVKGEFPALDAITAEVRCEDLDSLAESLLTASISGNHKITAQQVNDAATLKSTKLPGGPSVDDNDSARLNEALAAQQLQANFFATLAVRQSSKVSYDNVAYGTTVDTPSSRTHSVASEGPAVYWND